jgi:hypothetical protein
MLNGNVTRRIPPYPEIERLGEVSSAAPAISAIAVTAPCERGRQAP